MLNERCRAVPIVLQKDEKEGGHSHTPHKKEQVVEKMASVSSLQVNKGTGTVPETIIRSLYEDDHFHGFERS